MSRIDLEGIRLFANHGCMEEEAAIGSDYVVHLSVWANLEPSASTDVLADTVDYVALNRIVKEEMAIRSKLLEHVAGRILKRIVEEVRGVLRAKVRVCKENPPINGHVDRVCVVMQRWPNQKP